jgi:hypothetical protein
VIPARAWGVMIAGMVAAAALNGLGIAGHGPALLAGVVVAAVLGLGVEVARGLTGE